MPVFVGVHLVHVGERQAESPLLLGAALNLVQAQKVPEELLIPKYDPVFVESSKIPSPYAYGIRM